jgi:hypothetical protein
MDDIYTFSEKMIEYNGNIYNNYNFKDFKLSINLVRIIKKDNPDKIIPEYRNTHNKLYNDIMYLDDIMEFVFDFN